ncbi:MAG TPA: ATP-binding protein [Candidatus Mediterraneibacter norfolkensis]|nr:ATP-binding protein [Candidatus Mediterraneibacter norfolkensis]
MTENMDKKKIPIGIENFEKIRKDDFYYIDKTGLLRELLNNWGEVNLFTRPRRFGKSLNMSMLKSFLELGSDAGLFEGLEISEETELCREYQGQFPVVSVSLKDVEADDFISARSRMCSIIGNEALRFGFLAQSEALSDTEKRRYSGLIHTDDQGEFLMSEEILTGSLLTLSALLHKHYGKKVIVLIDEYDVPLAKANENGYYDQMVSLIRSMFSRVLKTNSSLYFAVMTGCLRVAKESIFTGLNNIKVLSVTDVRFDEYFGFTDSEVRELLDYYELSRHYETIREWYDGYHFGGIDVYCPWDVICYCDKLRADDRALPEDYWKNTSSNDVIRHFLEQARGMTKREIEDLISGGTVTKVINQELTYKDLYSSIDNMWSVLFTTGYLTQRGRPDGKNLTLAIPNREIQDIFTEQISSWFLETARRDGSTLSAFCRAFQEGDAAEVENRFNEYLRKTISVRDTAARREQKENFYHGLLLGLLGFKDSWYVLSNRESGTGYSDILIEIDEQKLGIVIEVKYSEKEDLSRGCDSALEQIRERDYTSMLEDDGMKSILEYGIACHGKKCMVKVRDSR